MAEPRILTRVKELEKKVGEGSGGLTMAAPAVTGNDFVAVGFANPFTASAKPGLLHSVVDHFVITHPAGEQNVPAIMDSCNFYVTVPEGTQADIKWPVSVYAVDSIGNKSETTTLVPTTSLSKVLAPEILSPDTGKTLGSAFDIVISHFATVGSEDTQTAAQYQVWNGGGIVIYDSGEITDEAEFFKHSVSLDQEADVSGSCTIQVRQKGSILGWSVWSGIQVSITKDYVLVLSTNSNKFYSVDGIDYEFPQNITPIRLAFAPNSILEVGDKIFAWNGSKCLVSDNGTDWVSCNAPLSITDIIETNDGVMAWGPAHYAIFNFETNSWSESKSFNLTNSGNILKLAYVKSTGYYVAIVREYISSKYAFKLYKTTTPDIWNVVTIITSSVSSSQYHACLYSIGDDKIFGLLSFNYNTSSYYYMGTAKITSNDGGETITSSGDNSISNAKSLFFPKKVNGAFAFTGTFYKSSSETKNKYFIVTSDGNVYGYETTNTTTYSKSIGRPIEYPSYDFLSGTKIGSIGKSDNSYRVTSSKYTQNDSSPGDIEWSENINKYLITSNDLLYVVDSFDDADIIPSDRLNDDINNYNISSAYLGLQYQEGYDAYLAWAHRSWGADTSYAISTHDGKNFITRDDSENTAQFASVYRSPHMVKAFDYYYYISPIGDASSRVMITTSPNMLGAPMPKQPSDGAAAYHYQNALIFTGQRLMFFPSDRSSAYNAEYITSANGTWTLGPKLTYDFDTNFSVDTDGAGKILLSHENGLSISSNHGDSWSTWVKWDTIIGFTPTIIKYLKTLALWVAYSGSNCAVSEDGLTWRTISLSGVSCAAVMPAVSFDNRIIIPTTTGVVLVDPVGLTIKPVYLGNMGSNPTVVSTFTI